MEQSVLLLIVFTVMVAGQTIDDPIFPLEYCGNRTACYNITFMEKPDEYCTEFAGKVAVPSKLCINGMILCSGHKYSAGCLYSVNNLRNNCDYAKENCYADLKEGATDPDPENPIFPVAACGPPVRISNMWNERTTSVKITLDR
uniref:Chitin-binding type-2 domain-containing protein n=1 Tax=Anopheles maculatus TaxID=74869 RepID=A0A182SUQ6_9DIPT